MKCSMSFELFSNTGMPSITLSNSMRSLAADFYLTYRRVEILSIESSFFLKLTTDKMY